jgi:hypothetical protein
MAFPSGEGRVGLTQVVFPTVEMRWEGLGRAALGGRRWMDPGGVDQDGTRGGESEKAFPVGDTRPASATATDTHTKQASAKVAPPRHWSDVPARTSGVTSRDQPGGGSGARRNVGQSPTFFSGRP